jgi:hypothetical protein
MLIAILSDKNRIIDRALSLMDKGMLHGHLQEDSKLEERSPIPYWIVSTSARTSIMASDVTAEAGQIVTTAAQAGIMGAALGGGRARGWVRGPLMMGAIIRTTMGIQRWECATLDGLLIKRGSVLFITVSHTNSVSGPIRSVPR